MLVAVLGLLVSASDGLGPVLRQEGFAVRPPRGFRMGRMDLFLGTRAGAVSISPAAQRYLSAALIDGEGEDAASLLFSVIDAPFAAGPSARDALSTAAVRHFRDELGQPFELERADVRGGRVEVLGSIRQGSQLRRVLVAAWPAAPRHVVAVASAPSGRWPELSGVLGESLDSFRLEGTPVGPPARLGWALAALVASALMVSIGLWRRRRAARGF
jgi:hypothetical protein